MKKNMINYCKTCLPVLAKASLKGFLTGPRMVLSTKHDTDKRPFLIKNYNNNYLNVLSGKIDHSIWVAEEVEKSLKERVAK